MAGYLEDEQHEEEDQASLADQYGELVDQMSEQDLRHVDSGHQTAVQQSLLPLTDEHGRSQGHSDKVDQTAM